MPKKPTSVRPRLQKRANGTLTKAAPVMARSPQSVGRVVTRPKASPPAPRRTPPVAAGDRSAPGGKYVYCIIKADSPRSFGPIGIGADSTEVTTIHYRDLAAVVSDAPPEIIDSTRENVLAHERVNETVMRDFTVIPMSFERCSRPTTITVELSARQLPRSAKS